MIAELLRLAVSEPGLRHTLARRAQARLDVFEADKVAVAMREAVEAL